MIKTPSPSFSILIRIAIPDTPGMLGRVASAIGRSGGTIGAVDIVEFRDAKIIRDLIVSAPDQETEERVVRAIRAVKGVQVLDVADRTFLMHRGGKIEVRNRFPLKSRGDLSMAYTPGVARVCGAIRENPRRVYDLTLKRNTVAIVTDGSAVLGLGNIGPAAALPVMEGKAMLFKEFGGVNAFPLCLDTQDPDEIVAAVKWIAPTFGGVNLEDISAPRCFDVEERLKAELDIPVFHDNQHGTAVVILAGLMNALQVVGKRLESVTVVINGLGAAGVAAIRLLQSAGIGTILGCDRSGILYAGRSENMNPVKERVALGTNPGRRKGTLVQALEGADVFIGLSQGGVLKGRDLKRMERDPIVFAMANPVPEVMPEEAGRYARIVATGRSDYPNQINNVLCFPGLFRGILDCNARQINEEMLLAAAHTIAATVPREELREDHIIPGVFNRIVPERVARAVRRTAVQTGAARLKHRSASFYR